MKYVICTLDNHFFILVINYYIYNMALI